MPLEIKELHIRVNVNQPQSEGAGSQASADANAKDDKEALVQQCIEQVMELLNNKNER